MLKRQLFRVLGGCLQKVEVFSELFDSFEFLTVYGPGI
jgi:hypothetical protein